MLTFPKDKVAITPINDPDMSPSGLLHIPDIAKERCDQGIVKYTGPDVKWVKVGMYVLFSGWSGTLVNIEGEGRLIVMQEDFVVAEIGDVENVFVPGLYYKKRRNEAAVRQELYEAIEVAIANNLLDPNQLRNVDVHGIASELANSGFYGPISAPYFQADFENIMNFIAMAFSESNMVKQMKIHVPKPTVAEYDEVTSDNN